MPISWYCICPDTLYILFIYLPKKYSTNYSHIKDDGPVKVEYRSSGYGPVIHSGYLDLMAPPVNIDYNYVVTCKAYLVPPSTGSYKLAGCADDLVKIYLSTDELPANKVQHLQVSYW